MRERTVTTYVAFDGEEFATSRECEEYELACLTQFADEYLQDSVRGVKWKRGARVMLIDFGLRFVQRAQP